MEPLDRSTAVAQIELDLFESVPRGALVSSNGERLVFAGWTELASAIEQWRTAAQSAARAESPTTSTTPETHE